MKRWPLLLLTALLLCGCGAEQENATTNNTEPAPAIETNPIEPTGYYDPDSALEESSNGAVKLYPLNRSDSYGLCAMGDDLLVFSGDETTTLTKLTGNNLYVDAVANLNCRIDPADPAVLASGKGVTYYDAAHRALVFLDAGLKEVSRFDLPEDMLGTPALSADRKTIYYCTADSLRALDLETKLTKLMKEISYSSQSVTAILCGGTVLECAVKDRNGDQFQLFVSVQTGETLYETSGMIPLWTNTDSYFAIHTDGAYEELLTGASGEEPRILIPEEYGVDAMAVMELNSAVLVSDPGEDSTQLDLYDLETGIRTSRLDLPGGCLPQQILADPGLGDIWLLRYDEDYASDALYRWDYGLTATNDSESHFGIRYHADAPDLNGLDACQEIANTISKTYGVKVLLWTDATAFQPFDYALEPEYQVPLLKYQLSVLEQALSRFPEGFLKKAASGTSSGKLRICLIRSITASDDVSVIDDGLGLQYWDDNGDAFVALIPGREMEQTLYHELFHIIDSFVLSNCSAYDNWNDLNPEGFAYTLDYEAIHSGDFPVTGEMTQAFIDLYSMTYPKEDRARIMEYAMMPDRAAYFESEAMQAKLYQLCYGIRKSFRLEKSSEVFSWEQYLKEPLASQ